MHDHLAFIDSAHAFGATADQGLAEIVVVVWIHERLTGGARIHHILAHPIVQRGRVGAQAYGFGVRGCAVGG